MNLRRSLWWLAFVIFFIASSPRPVIAAGAEFTVTPILSATQRPTQSGYFDIDVQPGVPQKLTISLHNQANQAADFTIGTNPAYTADSGTIAYDQATPSSFTGESSMHQLLAGPETVTLAAGETKRLTYTLRPPAKVFGGVISGALYIRKELDDTATSGVAMRSRFAFAMPVRLHATGGSGMAPTLQLAAASGDPLSATIANPSPHQFGQIDLTLKVIDAAKKHVWTQNWTQLAVAPTSHFTLTPPPPTLKPGQYTLAMSAKSGRYTWRGTQAFTVTAAAARKQAAAKQPVANSPWGPLTLLGALALALIALGGVYWGWRRQKRHA